MATPTVKWAQRKDRLFVTIDVQDVKEETVTLTADKLNIVCKVRAARTSYISADFEPLSGSSHLPAQATGGAKLPLSACM